VVGGHPLGETEQVLGELTLLSLHAHQQVQGQSIVRRGGEAVRRAVLAARLETEQARLVEAGRGDRRGGQALQSFGDTGQNCVGFIGHEAVSYRSHRRIAKDRCSA